jgi:hypothetical protein
MLLEHQDLDFTAGNTKLVSGAKVAPVHINN